MRPRLTSDRFVGRIGELAECELAVREARAGRPGLVLLGGDSGVGKTRLVGELERRLDDGATPGDPAPLVLRGDSVQQSDGELPYAPLLGALRPVVRSRHPALAALSAGSRVALATILPGLDDDPRAGAQRPGPADQMRLFESALELIDLLAKPAGLVLILEDVHWADRSTRAFAAFLARSLRQERVCLILSYRTDELHRRHPLRPLLSELERSDRARRIELRAFDRDELVQALSDILGAAPDAALVDRLLARGEGNPLYTEELLAAGLDGRGAAPQSLRDAFLGRIERLSGDAQRVARAVAVARTADEQLLSVLLPLQRDELQAALRDAVAEQVLIAADDGRFCFRHALLRETLYDDLLPGERSELHLALARHLEERGPGGGDRELERTSAIAGHYAAAGDQPSALRSTVVAARAAQRALAYGEVADLAERALELWARVPDPVHVAGLDHVALLTIAAEAQRMLDMRNRSVVLVNEALGELDPDAEPVRCAALLAQLARMTWALNRGVEGVQIAQRALAMLPADDTEVRPGVLAWLARASFLRGKLRESVADGEAALELAVAVNDAVAEAELLNTLGMARAALGDVDAGLDMLRRAIKVAADAQDLDSVSTAYANLADTLSVAGRTTAALQTAQEGLAATPRYHVRTRDWAALVVSQLAFEAGDWELASRALASSNPSPRAGTLFLYRQLCDAYQALGRGDDEAAQRCLDAADELARASAEPQWIGAHGALLAELRARLGDLDGAQAAVQEALDRMELCTDDLVRIGLVAAVGAKVEAERAQRASDLGLAAERRDAVARARLHVQRLEAAAQEGGPVERARLAEGRAELARARGRQAQREWAKAAAAWDAIARPYPAAVARWREAEALVAAGERERAAEVAGAAHAAASALGSQWLDRELRRLGDRARLRLSEAAVAAGGNGANTGQRDAATSAAGGEDPFGLTPRERQVLELLAQGATNRQIGTALYMAEKTASVHVSRILSKLGARGRTEAAALAHRRHLV
ncbi:MAG: helix-turn-helix transcriptional regulator [Solirubrobacteraceae bacterium]